MEQNEEELIDDGQNMDDDDDVEVNEKGWDELLIEIDDDDEVIATA